MLAGWLLSSMARLGTNQIAGQFDGGGGGDGGHWPLLLELITN